MSGASKRSLEDRLDEDSDYEWGWGEVVKCKYPRKETVDVGWAGPSSSGQAQNQQQQQPQQQQPSAWQQSRSYSSTFPEGRHEGKDKDREKENEWEVKAAETKEEEVKTEIKAEPKESKPDKDHYLTKGEKEPYIDGKDVSRDHRRQYQQLENEGFKGTVEEDGDFCETKEAVGENKVMDWKTEREEKKRKEESVNCSGERKEKERNREKDSIHSVKEVEVKEENVETDGKMFRRETDEKEKKKDKEKQGDNERQEKRTRHPTQDKEGADDGNIDGEGAPERERGDSFYGGIQQRRRMLRPRGHSQAGPREARSRFRPRDSEGFQGRSDPSAVVYKVGECMQEIIKLWKEFESAQALKNGENSSTAYPTLEIRIPAEHVTTANHQVRGSQLWGTDIYTDDSDLVAVLMHTGYYRPTAALPPPAIHELRATIRVLPPQDSYTSTLRNSVRSRAWGAASGCSYKVERCRIMKKGGGSIELEPCLMRISAVAPTLAPVAMERTMTTRAAASNAYRQQRFVREVTIQYNLCNEPWMKYSISIVADRGLKRSQFTSARLRKGEVLYVETHWNRYELSYDGERATCNGSFGATTATSIPSQTANSSVPCQTANSSERSDKPVGNEMEKHPGGSSHIGDKSQGRHVHDGEKAHIVGENSDRYKWALCKQPLPQKVMQSIGVPLPPEHVKVLEENLDWEEVLWSQTGVWVRGKEYCLTRAHFLSSS